MVSAPRRGDAAAGDYRPSGFFALRSPLLPLRALLDVVGEPGSRPDEQGEFERAIARDRAETAGRLRAAVAAPEVREAIFVASPSLAEALEGRRGVGAEVERQDDRAAYRYFARMSARSTPFGLFAGSSVGSVGERTDIVLAPRSSYRRHARIDMLALCSLVEALAADPATRARLRYVRNPSIYPAGGRLRYSLLPLASEVAFPLVDVEPTEHLARAIGAAESPASVAEIAATLRAAYADVDEAEALGFVDALIENGLLVPALVPAVTGPEPAVPFLEELGRAPELAGPRGAIAAAHAALGCAAEAPLGGAVGHYRETLGALRAAGVEVDPQRVYQVDLIKPLDHSSLGGAVADEMLRAVALLRAWARPGTPEIMARLMTRFRARYEGNEVPLVEALDDDTGVGFEGGAEDATPLLEGLDLSGEGSEGSKVGAAPRPALRDRLHRALARGEREIEIGPEGLGEAYAPRPGPDAFVVFATLAARSGAAVDAGEFDLVWPRVVAPSGVSLLARFCHADPELAARVRAHLALEDELAGEALLADVVHLPSGRLGNIMLRPALRPYEIVCNGRSGADPSRQLPASDLLVSARAGRFVVRSRRLGRRILPRITNAHNVRGDGTANVYRFLSALQTEELGASVWDWGSLANSEFLPRVRSGRTVFAPASWNVGGERLRAFVTATGARQFRALQGLREELGLPRWVAVEQSDNVLPFDLENPLCVETFAHLVKNLPRVRLLEANLALSGPVEGPEGAYAHELVVPFVRAAKAPSARPVEGSMGAGATWSVAGAGGAAGVAAAAEGELVEHRLAPGGEVLYAKFYGPPSCFDALVRDLVAPLARRAQARGAAREWFFIRYHDGEHHLRVRLLGERARLWVEVLPELSEEARPLLEAGRVSRWQLDTYDREVERYGGPAGVRLAERLFHADSEACAALFEIVEGEDQRWRAAALGVDALLADFGLNLEARFAFARRSVEALGSEYGLAEARARRSLDAKVRELGREAEALLRGEGVDEGPLADVRAVFARRSHENRPIVEALRGARARGELGAADETLLWSYAHMHANRVFVVSQRLQELVLHALLMRAYRAALAREGRKPSP